MEPTRSLRDVFAGLAGGEADPAGVGAPREALAEHRDLPDELLLTAVGSYAGTAPLEVAEHLAPVVLEGAGAGADGDRALDLLVAAPVGIGPGEVELGEIEPGEIEPGEIEPGEIEPDDAGGVGGSPGLDTGGLEAADALDQTFDGDAARDDEQSDAGPTWADLADAPAAVVHEPRDLDAATPEPILPEPILPESILPESTEWPDSIDGPGRDEGAFDDALLLGPVTDEQTESPGADEIDG